jgi:hypothetical protein
MTDERWQRVKALFQAAVERPAGERTAFLATAAADDDELRREVESLLASDASDTGGLDRLSIAAGAVHLSASHRRIGPYDIVTLIGAGAMGEVYRARDTKLNRDVALKVLPPLFALDPDRVARFKREAQVLAALNHPNVAAIYGLEESNGLNAIVLEREGIHTGSGASGNYRNGTTGVPRNVPGFSDRRPVQRGPPSVRDHAVRRGHHSESSLPKPRPRGGG